MKFRICNNEQCGAITPEEDCLDYKHPTGARLCPFCKETTEEISEEEIKCQKCASLFGEFNAKMATVHVPGVIVPMDHYCAEHFCEVYPYYRIPML